MNSGSDKRNGIKLSATGLKITSIAAIAALLADTLSLINQAMVRLAAAARNRALRIEGIDWSKRISPVKERM